MLNYNCCPHTRQLNCLIRENEKYVSAHQTEFFNSLVDPNFFDNLCREVFKTKVNHGRLLCIFTLTKNAIHKYIESGQYDKAQALIKKTCRLCKHLENEIGELGGWDEMLSYLDKKKKNQKKFLFKLSLAGVLIGALIFAHLIKSKHSIEA